MSPSAQLLAALKANRLERLKPAPVTFPVCDLYHGTLVWPGEKHLARGRNCQDYAVARGCPEGSVIAVTDGASNYMDEDGCRTPSFNEAGAILIAEIAVRAALEGLAAHLAPDALRDLVALQLHSGLRNLWSILGPEGVRTLCATLLLGVVTPSYTRLWVSGDGAWGLHVPRSASLETLVGDNLVVTERPGLRCIRGTRHTPNLRGIAAVAARTSHEAVVKAMPLALGFDGPSAGAWVATDGLRDEPAVARLLNVTPTRLKSPLMEARARVPGCDDFAVAWASEPFPLEGEVYDV